MLKVVKTRVVVLAGQVPVPGLPLGVVGVIRGFRITYNGASALPPTDVTFAAQNGGSPVFVANAQTGVTYIVDVPTFGDEDVVSVLTANTAAAYWVDFEFLIEENRDGR